LVFPSLARQRLYTTAASYAAIFGDLLLGRVHHGQDVERLEHVLRERLGVPHVLALNQARLGLHLAVKASLREGRYKVILSPFTIFDVVNMVICAGAEPVFADIDLGTCTIDAAAVAQLIDAQTAAVLVTHTHVMCPAIDELLVLCRRHDVRLIEDAAIAFGTYHGDRPVGTLGDFGVYSFGLFKNISAVYGGAVVTRDETLHRQLAAAVQTYRPIPAVTIRQRLTYSMTIDLATNPFLFRAFTYWVFRFGLLHDVEFINRRTRNDPDPIRRQELPDSLRLRIGPMQARLIIAQLGRVERHRNLRLELARYYHRELASLKEIGLPPLDPDRANSYLVFPIRVRNRSAVLRHLMAEGRDCASYYYHNCADLDCFAEFFRDCPNARAATEDVVLLPTYPRYGLREAAKNVASLRRYYARG
jgi:perosamine synthetase